jgi:hypothetical protein
MSSRFSSWYASFIRIWGRSSVREVEKRVEVKLRFRGGPVLCHSEVWCEAHFWTLSVVRCYGPQSERLMERVWLLAKVNIVLITAEMTVGLLLLGERVVCTLAVTRLTVCNFPAGLLMHA